MDKNEKAAFRVEIAQDVLAQLKARKFRATRGVYMEMSEKERLERYTAFRAKAQPIQKCAGCAIGSVFVCAFNKKNKLTNNKLLLLGGSDMIQYLNKWFDREQLRLMETAFEGYPIGPIPHRPPEEEEEAARRFCRGMQKDGSRLRKIMQNVIDNNGTFKP